MNGMTGSHGVFGIAPAKLLMYTAVGTDDRPSGYVAVLVVADVTIIVGLVLFRKWISPRRPLLDGNPAGDHGR